MRPADVLRRAERYLDRHGVESPRATAEVLLMHVLRTDRAGLYSRREGMSSAEARSFGRALCVRCAGTPVQHLTGTQAFRHLELEVRPGVFVPRPETEVVVEAALAELDRYGSGVEPVAVDVGTGSGAIALAIAQERPDARVHATDREPEAVALARRNAERSGLDVEVHEGDLLSPLPARLRGAVALVVSNPPYVEPAELDGLPAHVRADPVDALLGGTDVHRRLAGEAPAWLAPGGSLVMELGAGQGPAVAGTLEAAGFAEVHVLPDLAGRDRVAVGRLPDAPG